MHSFLNASGFLECCRAPRQLPQWLKDVRASPELQESPPFAHHSVIRSTHPDGFLLCRKHGAGHGGTWTCQASGEGRQVSVWLQNQLIYEHLAYPR